MDRRTAWLLVALAAVLLAAGAWADLAFRNRLFLLVGVGAAAYPLMAGFAEVLPRGVVRGRARWAAFAVPVAAVLLGAWLAYVARNPLYAVGGVAAGFVLLSASLTVAGPAR